jgi:hypothetical protein
MKRPIVFTTLLALSGFGRTSVEAFTPRVQPKVSKVILSPEGSTTELSVAGSLSMPLQFNDTITDNSFLSSWEEALMQENFDFSSFPKWDAVARHLHNFVHAHHRTKEDIAVAVDQEIHLVDLLWLKPHEQVVSEHAVEELLKATKRWGAYVSPLLVDRVTGAILDGHHRYHVGKRLGLKRVPAVLVDYVGDHSITVDVWDGCGKHSLTKDEVLEMSLSPHVFPPKTSKHSFSDSLPPIAVPLTTLQTEVVHSSDSESLDYHI